MQARFPLMVLAAGVLWSASAEAHIEIGSGPATANSTNEVTFNVEHGCTGADTYKVTVDIPAGVTSVRPMRSDFGTVSVGKDMSGTITSVSWQKALGDALDSDIAFYKLTIRLKVPNQPFTTLYFAAHQTCRAMDGTMTTVDWVGTPQNDPGGTMEPAAELNLMPARQAGWNKYTVPTAMSDLSVFFSDARIVWKGNSAYSPNANTATQVTQTPGASPLTALGAGDEIWVKY